MIDGRTFTSDDLADEYERHHFGGESAVSDPTCGTCMWIVRGDLWPVCQNPDSSREGYQVDPGADRCDEHFTPLPGADLTGNTRVALNALHVQTQRAEYAEAERKHLATMLEIAAEDAWHDSFTGDPEDDYAEIWLLCLGDRASKRDKRDES